MTADNGPPGRPRLVATGADANPQEYPLTRDVTTIGSSETADIRLQYAEGSHAQIRRVDGDEYLFENVSGSVESTVNGRQLEQIILRSGARIQIGQWTVIYQRESQADHDFPFDQGAGSAVGPE